MKSKSLFNIFPETTKIIKNNNKEKQKIIIDYREKNSLVISELINLGFKIEFRELKVADYIVNDVAIERKTVSDFISSMINKRLLHQIEELQQYKNKLLIIEESDEQELYSNETDVRFSLETIKETAFQRRKGKSKKTVGCFHGVNPNAIRGFLLSILLKHKIPIIFTKDAQDTAKFLFILSKRKEKEASLNAKKKSLNKKEQLQFILEGFPGIGPKTAKKLLKEFKTLKEILNTPLEKLEETIGKKAEIFKILEEKY